MSITEFYRLINAFPRSPASENDILSAEARLQGKLPKTLKSWYLEADGFDGEATTLAWRFKSLPRLHTIQKYFSVETVQIKCHGRPTRDVSPSDYVIFCDALFNLPFYATNICPHDPHFGEVIAACEEDPMDTIQAADTFDDFATFLFAHPQDAPQILIPEKTED